MELNLSKETILQIDQMSRIKGGNDDTLKASLETKCISTPPPQPLDRPCTQGAYCSGCNPKPLGSECKIIIK
ncbi:MAG: hypothetical protein LBS50_06375 [Prevotellaceae bacterium]|jgi:hypothetical protein|nr:hypothetical protein [Prevotellaceae bacterium]